MPPKTIPFFDDPAYSDFLCVEMKIDEYKRELKKLTKLYELIFVYHPDRQNNKDLSKHMKIQKRISKLPILHAITERINFVEKEIVDLRIVRDVENDREDGFDDWYEFNILC